MKCFLFSCGIPKGCWFAEEDCPRMSKKILGHKGKKSGSQCKRVQQGTHSRFLKQGKERLQYFMLFKKQNLHIQFCGS